MRWEHRARKLDAKRRYMPKHGYSVFVIDAAERKRAAEDKASNPAPSRRRKVSRRGRRR